MVGLMAKRRINTEHKGIDFVEIFKCLPLWWIVFFEKESFDVLYLLLHLNNTASRIGFKISGKKSKNRQPSYAMHVENEKFSHE